MDDHKLALFYQLGEFRIKMDIFADNISHDKNSDKIFDQFQELIEIFDKAMIMYKPFLYK